MKIKFDLPIEFNINVDDVKRAFVNYCLTEKYTQNFDNAKTFVDEKIIDKLITEYEHLGYATNIDDIIEDIAYAIIEQ